MNSYGWSLDHAMSHTLYQLEALSASINRRRYDDYLMLSNISRLSQTDSKSYEEFVNGLRTIRDGASKHKKVDDTPFNIEGFSIGNQ